MVATAGSDAAADAVGVVVVVVVDVFAPTLVGATVSEELLRWTGVSEETCACDASEGASEVASACVETVWLGPDASRLCSIAEPRRRSRSSRSSPGSDGDASAIETSPVSSACSSAAGAGAGAGASAPAEGEEAEA